MLTAIRMLIAPLLAAIAFLPIALYAAPAQGLENPLKFDSIQKFIEGFLRAIVMIAIPIITVFIVYAGFKFVAARGKPEDLNDAKRNFTYVIIGTILILSAWVLATLIGATVTQLLGS